MASGLGLSAQVVPTETVVLAAFGEFHLGASQAPHDLKETVDARSQRTLGWDFPLRLSARWQLRPRYDDAFFSGWGTRAGGAATVKTLLKQHHFGTDLLFTPAGDRWQVRPSLYLGGGIGFMQTWQERTLDGNLQTPGLPVPASEQTWSPAFRLLGGLQVTPWLALEAQVQTSTHHFEGANRQDTYVTLGLRLWPAAAFARKPPTVKIARLD